MKSVTEIKSLGDMRTIISTRSRSTPRQKGSTYLEVYLLDKERQRLGSELAMLAKRRKRIETRLGEIHEAMQKHLGKAKDHDSAEQLPSACAAGEREACQDHACDPQKLKKMTIEY